MGANMKFSGKTAIAAITVGLFFIFAASANAGDGMKTKPKLVLQITVDQLRGDLPTRYYERLGEGGFRYLWEKGVVYTVDVAKSLSAYIGIKPPSGAAGQVLTELFD